MTDHELAYDEQTRQLDCGERFVRCWRPHHENAVDNTLSMGDSELVLGLVHGLGDHSGRYDGMARWFASRGCRVYAFDLMGHGNSPGGRMMIPNYEALLKDVESFLSYIEGQHPAATVGLFGQSMGGNLVLNHQLRGYPRPSFVIAGSPMLRAANPPDPISLFLFRLLSYVRPHFKVTGSVVASDLSRDPECQQAFEDDPLVQRGITLRLARTLIDSGEWALQAADRVAAPTLVTHGSDDRITCHHASLEFAERSGDKATTRIWEHGKHDLHHDIIREDYFNAVAEWISSVVKY